MREKPKIGWIGLGKMGNPMCKNLIKAGYPMTVCDTAPGKTAELARYGAEVSDSAKTLAAGVDVIISMIPDDPALEDVCIGPNGAFHGVREGAIYIDMSTVSPIASSRIGQVAQKKRIDYLRAPVSGSTEFAAAGTLTILASGPWNAYDTCHPILSVLGKKLLYVGTEEESRYLKVLVTMMVSTTAAITAEALVLGERGGVDWKQMIDAINDSVVGSPLIGFKSPVLKDRDFAPAFTVVQMIKDLKIIMDTGNSLGVSIPITALVRQLYEAMNATGKGDLDYFGLVTLMEDLAGIRSRE
jgi:3-hydroxyisobutyrate dehydrogenase-like beta-hydroxyacid dehydrogenase